MEFEYKTKSLKFAMLILLFITAIMFQGRQIMEIPT